MKQNNQSPISDDINLVEILQKIWKSRKIAIASAALFAFFGVFFALSTENVFTASSTFIQKSQNNSPMGGNISSLASLAGINLGGIGSSHSDLPSTLYPLLVNSNPFLEALLKVPVPSGVGEISLREYLSLKPEKNFFSSFKKYTLGLPSVIKSMLFKKEESEKEVDSNSIKQLTIEDELLFERTKKMIILTVDNKIGYINLACEDKNPKVAAIIAKACLKLLQQEIINFKINNAKESLSFTENLYAKKKNEFEALQDKLATFRDQHQNISSGLFQNNLDRLESEYSILNAVNEELAKQVEQARIQVSKDTPIFTIIDPVIIPNYRTRPKRIVMVIAITIVGFFFGIGYALSKESIKKALNQIISNT